MTRQKLYARQRELIREILDIAGRYAELSKKTDRLLQSQKSSKHGRTRVEARGYV